VTKRLAASFRTTTYAVMHNNKVT